MTYEQRKTLAYIIGVALGDGNLSNPNGRAVRLRITCDTQYPIIIQEITCGLSLLLPNNRVSVTPRAETYCDISVYSNKLSDWLPWRVGHGSKMVQRPTFPNWVWSRKLFLTHCLRGLIHTDGCIYSDRGYRMLNFTSGIHVLATDVQRAMIHLGYRPRLYRIQTSRKTKYVVRLSRDVNKFLKNMSLEKS